MASCISVTHRPDGVAVFTFDTPNSRANVLSEGVWNELRGAVLRLRMRSDVKGLVLASAKPDVFIAGADLKFFANVTGPDSPAVEQFVKLGLSTLAALESLPFPTCAAIDGACSAAGWKSRWRATRGCAGRTRGPSWACPK